MPKGKWRTIKYKGYEEDHLPSNRTLLYLDFEDNYANRFRWTPRWKDLEEVFIKAIDVEKRNYPEGAWDEELKKIIIKSPSRPHDKDIFKASDSIINEHDMVKTFDRLAGFAEFYESQAYSLIKFLKFFDYESNKYISKVLHDSVKRMIDNLNKLCKFMESGIFFSPNPHKEDMKLKLWYAHTVIDEMRIDQETRDKQFYEYWEKLKSFVQDARCAYKDYRSNVREILFL